MTKEGQTATPDSVFTAVAARYGSNRRHQ